jgi:hypothetical protein
MSDGKISMTLARGLLREKEKAEDSKDADDTAKILSHFEADSRLIAPTLTLLEKKFIHHMLESNLDSKIPSTVKSIKKVAMKIKKVIITTAHGSKIDKAQAVVLFKEDNWAYDMILEFLTGWEGGISIPDYDENTFVDLAQELVDVRGAMKHLTLMNSGKKVDFPKHGVYRTVDKTGKPTTKKEDMTHCINILSGLFVPLPDSAVPPLAEKIVYLNNESEKRGMLTIPSPHYVNVPLFDYFKKKGKEVDWDKKVEEFRKAREETRVAGGAIQKRSREAAKAASSSSASSSSGPPAKRQRLGMKKMAPLAARAAKVLGGRKNSR